MIILIGFALVVISLALFFIALREDKNCIKSAILGAFSGVLFVFGLLLLCEDGPKDNQQEIIKATNSQSADAEKANVKVELDSDSQRQPNVLI